jgi:membrane protein DedA with SNARE-associated domain
MSALRTRSLSTWLLIAATVVVVVGVAYGLWWLIRHDAVLWLAQANQWIADTVVQRFGYAGVFVAMAIESSVIPVPSELIMPPAGDLARRLPDWSMTGVIIWGTLGATVGAIANYGLALWIGRPLVLTLIARFGKFLHVTPAAYESTEGLFRKHGAISVFVGRLLPGVRHLISIPAGLARMNLVAFSVLTALGAGIWGAILAYLGYGFGADPVRLSEAVKQYSHWVIGACLVLIALYAVGMLLRSRPAKRSSSGVQ